MVQPMPDVLLVRRHVPGRPELRHDVPPGIPDPFLYAERDGVKHIAIGSMEIPRLAQSGSSSCTRPRSTASTS